jgi:8-oxo-dGTP diphosphatase
MTTDNIIRIGTGILILNDEGKVLIGKRQGSHGAHTWAIIGGYIEYGESFEQAAQREAMEEVGVTLKDVHVLKPVTYFFNDGAKHHITIYMAARIASGTPRICEPHKMTELRFVDWKDIPQPTFVPYHAEVDAQVVEAYAKK